MPCPEHVSLREKGIEICTCAEEWCHRRHCATCEGAERVPCASACTDCDPLTTTPCELCHRRVCEQHLEYFDEMRADVEGEELIFNALAVCPECAEEERSERGRYLYEEIDDD